MLNEKAIHWRVYEIAREECELPEEISRDVAFHMTDWLDDLAAYYQFCRDPEAMPSAQAAALLMQFLVHVPNHVAAAGKLFARVPVTDIFGVGATREDDADAS